MHAEVLRGAAEGNARFVRGFGEAGDELLRLAAELFIKARFLNELEGGEAAGDRDGVPRKSARLVDGTTGSDFFHDVAASAEGRHRAS